jgi:hypothetical protein
MGMSGTPVSPMIFFVSRRYMKMGVRFEATLRAFALFLSVYFTLGWGEKSPPGWDVPVMVVAVAAAMVLRLMF